MTQPDHENQSDTGRSEESEQSRQPTAEELERRLAATRYELGETVEALGGKLDVGSRVRTRAGTSRDNAVARARSARDTVTDAVTTRDGSPKPEALAATAAVVAALVVVVVVRRHRR